MRSIYKSLIIKIILLAILFASAVEAFAHTVMLDVGYDPCGVRTTSINKNCFQAINEDGHDEWWYDLMYEDNTQ